MRRTWKKAKPKIEKKFNSNGQIKSDYVFLIGDDGEKVGKIETEKALSIAQELDQDLVEVNPTANPPIAKIMDYGQFKYESEKKAHKQRQQQKKVETKEIRLSVRISKHDFEFRLEQAKKFLQKGNKLKIDLILKGREKAHPEKAVETIKEFVAELDAVDDFNLVREQDLTKQGGRFNILLVNKKN